LTAFCQTKDERSNNCVTFQAVVYCKIARRKIKGVTLAL
jgi:hypothetical protein